MREENDVDVVLGESIMSASENLFDIAGEYPLKMKIVGVLRPSGTPDDRAGLREALRRRERAGVLYLEYRAGKR